MKSLFFFFTLLFISGSAQAQLNIGGTPYSWKDQQLSGAMPPFYTMAAPDRARLDREDEEADKAGKPPRFGFPHDVKHNTENAGTWDNLPNGDRVWRLGIECPGALSVNFLFDRFWLPEGATLYIYRPDRKDLIGGFTTRNNKGPRTAPRGFGTGLVYGDKVILELYEPGKVAGQSQLSIRRVVHGYRYISLPKQLQPEGTESFGGSGPCQVNVNCPEGDNWQDEKRGVALILIGGTHLCSGSLINNTCRNGDALFLTADHCLEIYGQDAIDNPDASDWAFWWNYETPGCPNPIIFPDHEVTNGATVLANNDNSDFALLRLTESPLDLDPSANVFLNGWDRTNTPGAAGVGIHHPAGDVKKIATHTSVPSDLTNYWSLFWSPTNNGFSVTEGGSSGSPLFASSALIIGQLRGGSDVNCDDPAADFAVYGKIGVSWNGPSPQRRLRDWLDPCGAGATFLTGGNGQTQGCPPLVLLPFPINNNQYIQSGGDIIASSTIGSVAGVTMRAATRIEMLDGFKVTGFLDAAIAPCFSVVSRQPGPDQVIAEENEASAPALVIFPNPTSGMLRIDYKTGCGKITFSIMDLRGVLLHTFSEEQTSPGQTTRRSSVDVSSFPPGTYLLQAQCSGFREVQKFTVAP